MRAKIIDQGHVVSKTVTQFSVNGEKRKRIEFNVYSKARRSPESIYADSVVFDAINKVGWKWADVQNYIDSTFPDTAIDGALQKAIDKHTIL